VGGAGGIGQTASAAPGRSEVVKRREARWAISPGEQPAEAEALLTRLQTKVARFTTSWRSERPSSSEKGCPCRGQIRTTMVDRGRESQLNEQFRAPGLEEVKPNDFSEEIRRNIDNVALTVKY
jgi:hypothetical protein